MRYSNVEFNVVYVDPSASTNGDGTSPTNATNALPTTAAGFADNTAYVIRRTAETTAAKLPNGTNSSLKNVLFLGMPNASDELYQLMPDEAKTAWGADAATYANIQFETASGSFQMPSINHFLLHRVHLFRDSIVADGYALKMNNTSSAVGCYSFEHCRFGSRGINLDKSSYATAVTASRCKGYVSVYYARILNVRDCVMNYAATGSSNAGSGIYCYYADILDVEDVKIHAAVGTESYNCYPLYLSGTGGKGIECRIRNVEMTVRLNGTAAKMPPLLCLQGYVSCEIEGIKVSEGTPLSDTKPTSLSVESPTISLSSVYELSLKSVSVSLPSCWSCKYPVLDVDRCYSGNYVPGVVKKIEDVTIQLAETDGIGSPATYANATSENDSNAAASISFGTSDCTMYAKVPQVSNLVVSNPRGKALYLENARMTDSSFKGTLLMRQVEADVLSVETWFPGKAVFASDGTHARIRKLTVNLANDEYPYGEDPGVFSDWNDNGSVFVDESNASLSPMSLSSSKANHVYQGIGSNNEGAAGHFVFRCANGICDTYSVHRTGGGASALKLYNNACSTPETMVVGRRPFNGMQLTPTTTGRHLLKAHIAYKGYAKDAEMYRHFIISATVAGRVYYSTIHGRWADDADAEWVNDSELTQKVLEMPIDIKETTPVDVRVCFSWYSSGGFVYLDPAIELKAV